MAAKIALTPIDPSLWSARHARHLLNRAGFGVPETRVAGLAAMSPERAVDALVDYGKIEDDLSEPDFLVSVDDYREMRELAKTLSEEERRKAYNDFQARERAAVFGLQAWWFERMTNTPRPLQEKMTLFWHGHFATSAQKIKSSASNYQLNSLLRRNATGNFKDLTIGVGQSPAMLRYLDNVQNVKGNPNENWARELMELFTLGVGNYTEQDIKESARAFTGWTSNGEGKFQFREERHDFGPKSFMGKSGDFDGWDIINIIFEQRAAAEYLPSELWTYFAYDNPEPELVEALGEEFRANDFEIAPILRTIFLSEAFYSDKALGTQIKSPAQFLVQLAHHLELESPPYVALARASGQLGQQLFYPPNVSGWDGGRRWINANTLLQRYNMSRSIVVADLVQPDEMSMMDMRAMQGGDGGYRAGFKATLDTMPQAQRREIQAKLKDASPEERRAIIESTMLSLESDQGWNAHRVFGDLKFQTVGECVEALGATFLPTPIAAEQQKIIAAALTPGAALDAPLSAENLTRSQMNSALHLLFSLAEYQLC